MSCNVYDTRFSFDFSAPYILHNGITQMIACLFLDNLQTLMIIAICETKEEDAESQILFWESLNSVMIQSGYEATDFTGFMEDEAGANWIAIRTVYNGGPKNILIDKEQSCLFH